MPRLGRKRSQKQNSGRWMLVTAIRVDPGTGRTVYDVRGSGLEVFKNVEALAIGGGGADTLWNVPLGATLPADTPEDFRVPQGAEVFVAFKDGPQAIPVILGTRQNRRTGNLLTDQDPGAGSRTTPVLDHSGGRVAWDENGALYRETFKSGQGQQVSVGESNTLDIRQRKVDGADTKSGQERLLLANAFEEYTREQLVATILELQSFVGPLIQGIALGNQAALAAPDTATATAAWVGAVRNATSGFLPTDTLTPPENPGNEQIADAVTISPRFLGEEVE